MHSFWFQPDPGGALHRRGLGRFAAARVLQRYRSGAEKKIFWLDGLNVRFPVAVSNYSEFEHAQIVCEVCVSSSLYHCVRMVNDGDVSSPAPAHTYFVQGPLCRISILQSCGWIGWIGILSYTNIIVQHIYTKYSKTIRPENGIAPYSDFEAVYHSKLFGQPFQFGIDPVNLYLPLKWISLKSACQWDKQKMATILKPELPWGSMIYLANLCPRISVSDHFADAPLLCARPRRLGYHKRTLQSLFSAQTKTPNCYLFSFVKMLEYVIHYECVLGYYVLCNYSRLCPGSFFFVLMPFLLTISHIDRSFGLPANSDIYAPRQQGSPAPPMVCKWL